MIKKIIPVFLCLCFSFAVICYGENTVETPEMQVPQSGEMPPQGEMPQRGEMPSQGEMPPQGEVPPIGERPSRGEMPQMDENSTEKTAMQESPAPVEAEQSTNQETENTQSSETMTDATPAETVPDEWEQREQGRMPFGQTQDMQNTAENKGFFEIYFDAIVSVILLILAYLFVILYKRRQY